MARYKLIIFVQGLLCVLLLTGCSDKEAGISVKMLSSSTSKDEIVKIGKVTFTMKYVKGGTFLMGAQNVNVKGPNYDADAMSDELPVHTVTINYDYWIGETEVTRENWYAVMQSGKGNNNLKNSMLPIASVSLTDIHKFIKRLNQQTGKKFALPSEAEWEFAARGGNESKGYRYSGSNNVNSVACYCSNSGEQISAVKTKLPNELGIYDMSGNVWEWCHDHWKYYDSGEIPGTDNLYAIRGGGWKYSDSLHCRITTRNCAEVKQSYDDFGFRLILR